MARALQLAELGRYSTQPNPRVGCVIVKHATIIGEGFHQMAGGAHAEINALEQAGSAAEGADIFVTLEPCSHHGRTGPCADALIKARPKRVVIAMQDPNPKVAGEGIKRLQAANIDTQVGVGEQVAKQLNRGFIKRVTKGQPFVSLKIAASLDGRIAMQSGESAWITSAAARKEVHKMRLQSCAVITGINTVLADNPKLTARLVKSDFNADYYLGSRQPVRIVLDQAGRLNEQATICQQAGETWQVVGEERDAGRHPVADKVITLPAQNQQLDLSVLLDYLAKQEMNEVMVEAGGTLAGSFIKAGLVDELVVFQSPDIMGSNAQPMFHLPEINKMNEKIHYAYVDLRKIGRDLKLVLAPQQK